jgi:hypothetical protein
MESEIQGLHETIEFEMLDQDYISDFHSVAWNYSCASRQCNRSNSVSRNTFDEIQLNLPLTESLRLEFITKIDIIKPWDTPVWSYTYNDPAFTIAIEAAGLMTSGRSIKDRFSNNYHINRCRR